MDVIEKGPFTNFDFKNEACMYSYYNLKNFRLKWRVTFKKNAAQYYFSCNFFLIREWVIAIYYKYTTIQ